jgi:peptide-methionine (R)-S-oxide reductase
MPFEPLRSDPLPRRAFLITPIAFAGLAALCYRRERTLPDAAQEGSGPEIPLTLFSKSGTCQAVRRIRKLVLTDVEWRRQLTPEEYAITRQGGTEFAFTNRYWNHHRPGLYRCVCCGNALFRSQDKFDSGTGWPSFCAPMAPGNIYTRVDASLGLYRKEVLCRKCDAHLGHVFDDGPPPSGARYCLNSTALRFIAYK